jgi:hypothetical protein
VPHPLVTLGVGIELGAEGNAGQIALCTLIDDCAEHSIYRRAICVGFKEVLADKRPQRFHQPAATTDKGEIATQAVLRLLHVVDAHEQAGEDREEEQPQADVLQPPRAAVRSAAGHARQKMADGSRPAPVSRYRASIIPCSALLA